MEKPRGNAGLLDFVGGLMRAKMLAIGVILLVVGSLVVSCGGAAPNGSSTTGAASSTSTTALATTTTVGPTTSSMAGSTTTHATTSTTLPASTTSTAALDSGITGLVTIGPISPVEQPGVPNEKPYEATILVKRSDGTVVAQVRSGADGRFAVKLPPGAYVLEPQIGAPLPRAETQQVTVSPHTFTAVIVAYDSGIR
jgi:hypothetical protein